VRGQAIRFSVLASKTKSRPVAGANGSEAGT
jgi:hypothetical protein